MVINRMMADEMERVKATMTASGGIKKMLQGSWWLTAHENPTPVLNLTPP